MSATRGFHLVKQPLLVTPETKINDGFTEYAGSIVIVRVPSEEVKLLLFVTVRAYHKLP